MHATCFNAVYKYTQTGTGIRFDYCPNWTWEDVLTIRGNGRTWLSPSVSSAAAALLTFACAEM
jgi:hypothetical protein